MCELNANLSAKPGLSASALPQMLSSTLAGGVWNQKKRSHGSSRRGRFWLFTVHSRMLHPCVAITERSSNDAADKDNRHHLRSVLCVRYHVERCPCLISSNPANTAMR